MLARTVMAMFCSSMLHMVDHAMSGKEMHCQRMVAAPMRMTSGSSARKMAMTCGAKIQPTTASSRSATVDTLTQNQNPRLTRSYLRAPKLKPHTGWKPCPKPIIAEPANCDTRVTMLIAAMAASP